MIRFSLKCTNGHAFESWFQSGPAFDALNDRGLVTCPHCGTSDVEKALMAPAISGAAAEPATAEPPRKAPDVERRIKELRAYLEANSDYVGEEFASEARAMYLGDVPERPIHGVAAAEEAKALLEDGVPVMPLPFAPTRKAN